MNVGSAVTYLYADNLGSTMVITGTAVCDQRCTLWVRRSWGCGHVLVVKLVKVLTAGLPLRLLPVKQIP
jgi:hypothetical protein